MGMGRLMSAMPQQVSPNAFQAPPNSFQRPPSAFQRPPNSFQRPPSAFQRPPSAFQAPPNSFQRPPIAFQRPQNAFQMGGLRGMMPFGQPTELGKLTIIKAGPGFHEEKHFDIGPNGKLTEVNAMPMHDALEHANPMDTHFNSNDVEVFHDEDEDIVKTNDAVVTEVESEKVEKEPVMDVRGLEEQEPELPKLESVEDFSAKEYPFLSVLRNTVEENERISQQILSKYRSMAEEEYLDDNSCSSHHLKWSDWVACLHARVGVPRWLTATTISLGLVISSAAPKQRIRALVIKTEKPSAALAKAKEAEAASKACEAAGVDPKTVVSVVRVDLPPCYGEVRPASPAPSYRSVAPATKEEEAEEK